MNEQSTRAAVPATGTASGISCIGWATPDAHSPLGPVTFERRAPGPRDVVVDIAYCGVCHSDVHQSRGEWGDQFATNYPCLPGHEIVGRVRAVGHQVRKHAVGDLVGVGVIVDSCQRCEACEQNLEQYCLNGATATYNARDETTGEVTFGGYSDSIVVTESFVLEIPETLDAAAAAPLLCAGITTWSPLRHFNVGAGHHVGVVGLGGLGHLAVKLANGLGAEVTAITRSSEKAADARRYGASEVVISSDTEEMIRRARSLDLIVSTLPATHDINPFLGLLERDGTYVIVGALEPLRQPVHANLLVHNRLSVCGSMIGGIAETQEMLDFCAANGIAADIQQVAIGDINEVFDKVVAGEARYRYVVDMASLDDTTQVRS